MSVRRRARSQLVNNLGVSAWTQGDALASAHGTDLRTSGIGTMVIALPKNRADQKRAIAWLVVERIQHLKLFQAVQINCDRDGEKFRTWLVTTSGGVQTC